VGDARGFGFTVLRELILGGSGVSSSLSMKVMTFFWGYPPGRPLGGLACAEEPVASSDAARIFTEVAFDPKWTVELSCYSVAPSHIRLSSSHLPPRSKQVSIRISFRNQTPAATSNATTSAPSRSFLVFIRLGR
jgi:hypothetical protein